MKKLVLPLIILSALVLEITLFAYRYFSSEHGYKKMAQLKTHNASATKEVIMLKKEVADLEKQCADFKKYPYYKEKIIREELQMIKPDEIIYKLI